ncbi:MAG: hypothetical protein M3083_04010 [Actinomycetota bacterium]|nr:hypothetical protein [Actinomycetota bacterium]
MFGADEVVIVTSLTAEAASFFSRSLVGCEKGLSSPELGRRAAEAALAPLIWREAVGDRWDTTETAEFLGVTRQALHDRIKRGTLLGIPGRGVTWFPIWQFDLVGRRARPVVVSLLQVFRNMDRPLEAVEIASWAQRPHAELDDVAPADWVAEVRAEEPVVTTARHMCFSLGRVTLCRPPAIPLS